MAENLTSTSPSPDVILVPFELPEILGMCDRILMMHEGEIIREFPRSEATQERIRQTIFSGNRQPIKENS